MQAIIKKDLLDIIDDYFEGKEGHRSNDDFLSLCDRISGKEVTLVFTHGDAFEVIDNNWWLPECCWTEKK